MKQTSLLLVSNRMLEMYQRGISLNITVFLNQIASVNASRFSIKLEIPEEGFGIAG